MRVCRGGSSERVSKAGVFSTTAVVEIELIFEMAWSQGG